MYTLNTDFYRTLNYSLATGDFDKFSTFIKTLLLERIQLKGFCNLKKYLIDFYYN